MSITTTIKSVALALAAAGAGLALSTAHAGRGIEPLDADEASAASQLVMAEIDQRQMVSGGGRTELLRTEVFDPGKRQRANGSRLAKVFVYDYSANRLIVGRVDLARGRVDSLKALADRQPPLSRNEISQARSVVLSDPESLTQIASEFQRITGNELNVDEITVHVRGFNPALARNRTNRRSESCESRRCARVTLVADGSTLFNFVPVVDLATGQVIQRIPFGPQNNHARETMQRAARNRQRARAAGARAVRNHGNHQH